MHPISLPALEALTSVWCLSPSQCSVRAARRRGAPAPTAAGPRAARAGARPDPPWTSTGIFWGAPADVCVCSPLVGTCQDGTATMCRADGSGTVTFQCDPVQGMTCDPDGCKGACAPAQLGSSYIGCDYLPTVTINPVYTGFNFAVAVSNTADVDAHITVSRDLLQ